MDWLNYHHLLYFWMVAREGSVTRACKKLYLTQPTISGQIRALENSLQVKLFDRVGRNLVLTETGKFVYRYADEIFSLGQDLADAIKGRPTARPIRLQVGIADILPRWIVYQLLKPALELSPPIKLVCQDDKTDRLLGQLLLNEFDVVLADAPAGPLVKGKLFNHLLGECSISFLGTAKQAALYRSRFPDSLDGAPIQLPMEGTSLRRSLEEWFERQRIRPLVRCEVGDCDLFEVFSFAGAGVFAAPTVLEKRMRRQFKLHLIGRVEEIQEKYFAITNERKLKHPAVIAIWESARRTFLP